MRKCVCPEEVKPELGYTHLPHCPRYKRPRTQYQQMYGDVCLDDNLAADITPGSGRLRRAPNYDAPVESVNHPAHYGGADDPYEVIKVCEAWGLDEDAYLFNVVKYVGRPSKGDYLEDLKKARFYLNRKIERMEKLKGGGS